MCPPNSMLLRPVGLATPFCFILIGPGVRVPVGSLGHVYGSLPDTLQSRKDRRDVIYSIVEYCFPVGKKTST